MRKLGGLVGGACAAVAALAWACGSDSATGADAAAGVAVVDAGADANANVGAEAGADAQAEAGANVEAGADAGCGAFIGDTHFTCAGDGNSRAECNGGALDQETCANGCLREDAGTDSVCMGTTTTFACPGSYGTERAEDGNYYISEFGCWVDADGGTHTDTGDNCIPSCFTKAKNAGLCDPNGTGAECEEKLNWFTADGARFGCLQRLRVTNPANGKTVIAIALDFGPGCPGENAVQHAVLDSSGALDDYLFGGAKGASEKAAVHVVEVDDTYPLGPVP